MLPELLIMALATATISVTVAQSKLCKPVREWITQHWTWGGDLISCPYCLGHWVAAVMVTIYPWTGTMTLHWWVILWLATTSLAALIGGAIGKLYAE